MLNQEPPVSISVIDTESNTIIGCVDNTACTLGTPQAIAITPNGAKAYVCTAVSHNSVSVIDTTTNAAITSLCNRQS